MRWPWRRKRDDLGPLLDSVKAPPRTVITGRPAAHENAAKLRAELAGISAALADATETITNPYGQETTMTTPEPLVGITPFSTIQELTEKLHKTGQTVHISTEGTTPNGAPRTIKLDTLKPTVLKVWEKAVLDGARALAAGRCGCYLIETGGTADGGGHQRIIVDTETGENERLEAEWQRREAARDLPLWLSNVVDAARTISDPNDSDHYRGLHTPGLPIVVLTEQYLEQIKREAVLGDEDDTHLANLVREVANAEHPYTTEIMGVKIARCDTRGRTDAERAEYQRGLRDAVPVKRDPNGGFIASDGTKLTAEPAVGTPAWLRDLADRLQQYLTTRFEIPADTAGVSVGSPDSIREHANDIERREHRAAADTRERERVEKIVLRQWETAARATVDAALASLGEVLGVDLDNPAPEYDVAGFWATLTDEQKADALAPALELYRAGRDDQEADHA